jgi:hypothetical protein
LSVATARENTPQVRAADAMVGAAVQPNPILGLLTQMTTAGAFVGSVVAYRRRRRDPTFDPFPIVTRWSAAGFVIGIGFLLHAALA